MNQILQPQPPLSPPYEVWQSMTPLECQEMEESLLAAYNEWLEKMNLMPASSKHSNTLGESSDVLKQYYRDQNQSCFVAFDLFVNYPDEDVFSPDLLVVFDAENYERTSWTVARERKGLDFVLEVVSPNSEEKDMEDNVKIYAGLGIPEYFYFNLEDFTLQGYILKEGTYTYKKIPFQKSSKNSNKIEGIYSSQLGLYLRVEEKRLRFLDSKGNHLLFFDEISEKNKKMLQELKAAEKEKEQALEREKQALKEKKQAQTEKEQALEREKQAQAEKKQAQVEKKQAQVEKKQVLEREAQTHKDIEKFLQEKGIDPQEYLERFSS